jgi:hypothetical protein
MGTRYAKVVYIPFWIERVRVVTPCGFVIVHRPYVGSNNCALGDVQLSVADRARLCTHTTLYAEGAHVCARAHCKHTYNDASGYMRIVSFTTISK